VIPNASRSYANAASRVLILAPPMLRPGGVQRYIQSLQKALQELLNGNVRLMAIPTVSNRNGARRLSLAVKARFAWKALREAQSSRPDLIVCGHIGVAPIGLLIQKVSNCPYWVIAYGIEVWPKLPLSKRRSLGNAKCVIAISNFTRDQVLQRHGLRAEQVVTLKPCVLKHTLLSLQPEGRRLSQFLADGDPVILTVARLASAERYKGHDTVLRALPSVIAAVPRVRYLVVGGGDDRRRLEQLAQEVGVLDHVIFFGEAETDAVLAACYQASSVFVMPARTVLSDSDPKGEGFGIVYLEAMAFGKPVIVPDFGAPAEIIHPGEHGLQVDPESTESVAQALVHLLTCPEEARRMGEQARDWVNREYSYAAFRNNLANILRHGNAASSGQPIYAQSAR
jgi:phosphatidyl-myo-inositol dimannoside synthase